MAKEEVLGFGFGFDLGEKTSSKVGKALEKGDLAKAQKAFDKGFDKASESGGAEGFEAGFDVGFDTGLGFDTGFDSGFDTGFDGADMIYGFDVAF